MQLLNKKFWTRNLTVVIFSVCCVGAAHAQDQHDVASKQDNRLEIAAILTAQAQAWNEGDLEKFMATYWKSEKLTFSSGGKTTYGWSATLANYRKSYAPPNQMGKLKFDHLEIIEIESNSALVLGQWHLQMKDDAEKNGNFSLVVKKLATGWKIIHDHSSSLEPTEKKDVPAPQK